MYRVDSEVGLLRQVILHRPGMELKRLTPGNKDHLLFDDVLWVARAQQEHDTFAALLRGRGVAVHLFGELLHATVDLPEARKYVLDRIFDDRVYGPLAIDALRNCFDAMDTDTLTEHLIGGITKREVLDRIPEPRSIAFHVLAADDFVLEPPTTSTRATRRPGSTAGSRSTACARRHGCARPCTTRPSTGGTRCSPARTTRCGPTAR